MRSEQTNRRAGDAAARKADHPGGTITSQNIASHERTQARSWRDTLPMPLAEQQLIQTIKAHIAKGDKAKDKVEQHYIAAGQHLKTLKGQHGGTWTEWEALLKEKIGIGKSRASELMQIADGRKTVRGGSCRWSGAKGRT